MTKKLVIVIVLLGMCGLAFTADTLVHKQVVSEQQRQSNSAVDTEEGKHGMMKGRQEEQHGQEEGQWHKLGKLAEEEEEARKDSDATDKKHLSKKSDKNSEVTAAIATMTKNARTTKDKKSKSAKATRPSHHHPQTESYAPRKTTLTSTATSDKTSTSNLTKMIRATVSKKSAEVKAMKRTARLNTAKRLERNIADVNIENKKVKFMKEAIVNLQKA